MFSDRLIVALDYSSPDEAMPLVTQLGDSVSFYKVGPSLVAHRHGMIFVDALKNFGKKVFLDLKLNDIPSVVTKTVRQIAERGIDCLSIDGGHDTMRAAVEGSEESNLDVYGVTVLTSQSEETIRALGHTIPIRSLVGQRTDHAVNMGMAGLLCAGEDTKLIKSWSRNTLKVIVSGVTLTGQGNTDQKRTVSLEAALKSSADHIIIGRGITDADNPADVVASLLESF